MLLLVFPQEICYSKNFIVFEYCHSVCTKMFQATFWNSHKTCTVVPTTEEKYVEFPIFFSSFKNFIYPHIFCSSKIRIFNSRLVSNKNILSIFIFNSVVSFEIYMRSIHCTLVHFRSWTQCDHSSLLCIVSPIRQCKSTAG